VTRPAGEPRAPSAGEEPDRPPAGPLFEVRDPATEAVIERLAGATAAAADADAAVERAAAAAAAPLAVFGNAGQDCCARSRILVERSAMEEFLSLLEPEVTGLRVGCPADERTQMGPLISAGQRETVARFVPEGTPVAIRGSAPDGPGYWYPPTVLTGVDPGDRAATEEIFGPVAVVLGFADEDEGGHPLRLQAVGRRPRAGSPRPRPLHGAEERVHRDRAMSAGGVWGTSGVAQ